MAFYTKNYLLELGEETVEKNVYFFESVNKAQQRKSFDIFLSHDQDDRPFIRGLYTELNQQGFSVYVDWIIDPQISRQQAGKFAIQFIRTRLRQCTSLIYATSKHSADSHRTPWEMGFKDGENRRCAILPILDQDQPEYYANDLLSVYPYVAYDRSGFSKKIKQLHVFDNQKTFVNLKDWQKGHDPIFHFQLADHA